MRFIYYLFLFLLILASSPLLIVISILNLLLSGSPVFFRQLRTGMSGKPFVLYKFRTMVVGAEKMQHKYLHLNEATSPAFKIHADPRFTPFGKFLSHTGLDELPQLLNVLKGDMSIFGPRPLPVFEAQKLTADQKRRHIIKPGIISPWIIEGYHKNTFASWMASDLAYIKNKSLWYDITLLFKAINFVIGLFIVEVKCVYSQKN